MGMIPRKETHCLQIIYTLSILFTSLYASTSFAAPVSFELLASHDQVSIQQSVRVSVELKLNSLRGTPQLIEPEWAALGWSVQSRSQSTSMSIINNRRSMSISYDFQLRPRRTGTLTVGPFEAGGVSSDTLSIKVYDGPPRLSPELKRRYDRYALLRWEVKKKELWFGEQAEVSLMLYVNQQLRLTGFRPPEINLEDFWTQSIEASKRTQAVKIGNTTYQRQEVARYRLSPLRAGNVQLPELTTELSVATLGFFGEEESISRTASKVSLTVKELPKSPYSDFSGPAVGEVNLRGNIDRTVIRADEGIQFSIKTTTTGSLVNTPSIELPLIDGFKVFPPTLREGEERRGREQVRVRTQTWLLRPLRGGQLEIPIIHLSYFNPKTGEYAQAKTRPISVRIQDFQGTPRTSASNRAQIAKSINKKQTQNSNNQGFAQKEATSNRAALLGVQLKSITTSESFDHDSTHLTWLPRFFAILAFVFVLLSEGKRFLNIAQTRNTLKNRSTHAAKRALKALDDLTLTTTPMNHQIEPLILNYLEDRFDLKLKAQTREMITQSLIKKGIERSLIEGLKGLLEAVDFARFSSATNTEEKSSSEVIDLTIRWIKELELHLKQQVHNEDIS